MQDLAEEKQRILRDRLERLFTCNERRCAQAPVYGNDLLSVVQMQSSRFHPPAKESQWGWVGSVNCLLSSHSSKDNSDPLGQLILSTEQQKTVLEPLARR